MEPGGLGPEHRLAADARPLALPTAPGWGRPKGGIANVQSFERRTAHGSQWPGLGRRSGISAAALPALHRPVALGLAQHLADRTSAGAGESALVIRQLPHTGASLQPARGIGSRGGLHRWPAGESPTPEELSLDVVLGGGLLAGACKALVLHRAIPDPSTPAESRRRSADSDPTARRRTHHELSGPAVQPTNQRRLSEQQTGHCSVERTTAQSQ